MIKRPKNISLRSTAHPCRTHPRHQARGHRYLRCLLLCWGLAAAGLAGCGEKIDPGNVSTGPQTTVSVPVATARFTSQPFIYEAVGTVTAGTASTLSGKLMGTVKEVRVREGDTVKTGDVLVVVDDRQVSARYKQAEAALAEARRAEASARSAREAARAQAELARSTYARYVKLMKDDSASQQEFDEVAARHRQAEATLAQTTAMSDAAAQRIQQAAAAVAGARVGKRDAAIHAPYDGTVTAKMVEEGDLASPGTPFLTIEKAGAFCVDLLLPEQHIQSIRRDQKVDVSIPGLGGKGFGGRIDRIVPAADQKSRSFLVKVTLPEVPDVRSGMFARVSVPVGAAGMILVPVTAIVHRGQLTGIYLVDDKDTARFRLIRTGRVVGDTLEVISGIKDGDRYVVVPTPKLVNGSRVEVAS